MTKSLLAAPILSLGLALIIARAGKAAHQANTKVEASLEINAPVSEVWEKSLEVRTWPEWIPSIQSTSFEGEELILGSKFKLKIRVRGITLPFTLTVCQYDQYQSIAWTTGKMMGITVVRSLSYEARGDQTLVTSREAFSGPLAGLVFRIITARELESIHVEWLKAIQQRVEATRPASDQ